MRKIILSIFALFLTAAAGAQPLLLSADKQAIGFTGYFKDTESGLYYAKGRYYDPQVARFLSEDQDPGSSMQPPSLHCYLYAYANPTRYVDPDGRRPAESMQFELRRYRDTLQTDAGRARIGRLIEYDQAVKAEQATTIEYVGAAILLLPIAVEVGATYGAIAASASPGLEGWATAVYVNGLRVSATAALVGETGYAVSTGAMVPSALPTMPPVQMLEHEEASLAKALDGGAGRASTTMSDVPTGPSPGLQTTVVVEDGLGPRMAPADAGGARPGFAPPVSRPPDSEQYSVAFRAQLERDVHYPGKTDTSHFQESNRQLDAAMSDDPAFAAFLETAYPGIGQGVQPGPRGAYPPRAPTRDVTWHHNAQDEGAMDLVPRDQHRAPGPVQDSLHPNQRGGMELWGGSRTKKAPPEEGATDE